MRAQLKIVWDGGAPGLSEHQLSVSTMGEPLHLLLQAIRRIASNILVGADDLSERGVKGGRLANMAQKIDMRISAMHPGSLDMNIDVVFPGQSEGQLSLPLPDLPEATLKELLSLIEAESKGESRNGPVRKYLRCLPRLSSQRYSAYSGETEIGSVEIGNIELPDEPTPQTYLVEVHGIVSGVSFAPLEPDLRIKRHDDGAVCRLHATAEQVDHALELREHAVIARAMTDGKGHYTLLMIRKKTSCEEPKISEETLREHVLARWRESLKRLSA